LGWRASANLDKEIENITKKIYHGNYTQAYKKLKAVLKDESLTKLQKAEYYALLSNVEKLTHRHKDALASIRKAISNTPKSNVLMNLRVTLLKADIYLNLVRFNESLKIIDEAESIINKNKKKIGDQLIEPEAYLNFVRGVAFRVKGYPNEAKSYLEKGISLYEKTGNKQGKARSLRNLGLAFSDNGELDKAIEFYKMSYDTSMSIDNKRDSIHPLAYIAYVYLKKGQLDESANYVNQRLKLSNSLKYQYGIFSSIYFLGNLSFLKGKIKNSLKLYKETMEICVEIGNDKFHGLSAMNIGACYKELGDLSRAEEYLNKAYDVFQKMKSKQFMTEVLIHKGDLLIQKGQIDKAIKIFRKALLKFEQIGNVFAVAQTQQYIGNVYLVRGDLEESLKCFTSALDYYEKSQSQIPITWCLHRIGWVYWQAGKLIEANGYLMKSYTQAKTINNLSTVVDSLLGLITINVELKRIKKAENFFEELQQINRAEKNKVISMETRLAEAIIYKASENERDQGRAEILFETIINEPILFFPYTVMAILNLSELLLMNIKRTNNQSSLDKLKQLVTKLYTLAKEQELNSLLAEAYWMQSQIALIDRDAESAQEYLKLANNMIDEKNLIGLVHKFKERKSFMIKQIPKISELKGEEITISQLVDHLQLIDSIKQITKDTAKDLHQSPSDGAVMKRLFEFK